MKEICLVLIKPDGVFRKLSPIIIKQIKESGLIVVEEKFLTATEEQCKKHYHIKVRNYGATEEQIVRYLNKSYLKNKNICIVVVEGENAINKTLQIKNKIRKNFALDTMEKCKAENRAWHNIIHSSDSVEDAEKEIEVWLK